MKDENVGQNRKTRRVFRLSYFIFCLFLIAGCNKKEEPAPEAEKPAAVPTIPAIPAQPVPAFNADHAFADMKTQVALGPRNPNTPAHEKAVHAGFSISLLRVRKTSRFSLLQVPPTIRPKR